MAGKIARKLDEELDQRFCVKIFGKFARLF
jgi:hypothetical protein